MLSNRRRNLRFGLAVLTIALAVAGTGSELYAQELSSDRPLVTYNDAADSVVLEYFVDIADIADEIEDMEARVRIYGDGTVIVHYPDYTLRRGDYTMRLSADELQALLDSLAERGLFEFDAAAAQAWIAAEKAERARAARSGAARLQARSSDVTTILRVHAESYRPAGSDIVQRNLTRDLVWYGLASDAEAHPGAPGLADLASAVDEIAAIAEHSALVKLN